MPVPAMHPPFAARLALAFVAGIVLAFITSVPVVSATANTRYTFRPSYYQILGVSRCATDVAIKRMYHRLAVRYHPDKNKRKNAEEMFIRIAAAHEVLMRDRRSYDMELERVVGPAPSDCSPDRYSRQNSETGDSKRRAREDARRDTEFNSESESGSNSDDADYTVDVTFITKWFSLICEFLDVAAQGCVNLGHRVNARICDAFLNFLDNLCEALAKRVVFRLVANVRTVGNRVYKAYMSVRVEVDKFVVVVCVMAVASVVISYMTHGNYELADVNHESESCQ